MYFTFFKIVLLFLFAIFMDIPAVVNNLSSENVIFLQSSKVDR